jgi:hypothetical protein
MRLVEPHSDRQDQVEGVDVVEYGQSSSYAGTPEE